MKDMPMGGHSLPGGAKGAFVGCSLYVETGSSHEACFHRPFNVVKAD